MLKPVSPVRLPVVAAAAIGLLTVSCDRDAEPVAPPPDPSGPVETRAEPAVRPTTIDRRELLSAVARAASDYAAGATPAAADPLVGRQFDVRLAFGCDGAEAPPADGSGDGLARWSWGPERETLRLSLTPGDWTRSALIAGAGQDQWEAVEGFWVSRPWMTAEGCPAIRGDPLASGPVAPSPQTVGLAAVFETGGSRLGRRNGRAYIHALRQAGDAPLVALDAGYRVRLQGRIAAFPSGRAIRCRAANPDQHPVCVAAAQLDRVAFETPTGETLSEWRPG